MITKEKLSIYRYFDGDIDGWARVGTKEQKAIMKDKDWLLIDGFVQDIRLIKNKLVSESFMKEVNKRLQESCDGAEVIQELKQMA